MCITFDSENFNHLIYIVIYCYIEFESILLNDTVEDRTIWEQKFYEQIILPALREVNDPKDPETQLYMKFNKPRLELDYFNCDNYILLCARISPGMLILIFDNETIKN